MDDDVVAIVANGGHGADAAKTENGSGASIEFTQERAKDPDTSTEAVEEKHWELRDHHSQIGDGQVDDEHVGRSFQLFGFQKQMENQGVSYNIEEQSGHEVDSIQKELSRNV